MEKSIIIIALIVCLGISVYIGLTYFKLRSRSRAIETPINLVANHVKVGNIYISSLVLDTYDTHNPFAKESVDEFLLKNIDSMHMVDELAMGYDGTWYVKYHAISRECKGYNEYYHSSKLDVFMSTKTFVDKGSSIYTESVLKYLPNKYPGEHKEVAGVVLQNSDGTHEVISVMGDDYEFDMIRLREYVDKDDALILRVTPSTGDACKYIEDNNLTKAY